MAQVSKNTAKSVRDEMEARGQIDHVENRTDTKGRKQPAKKKATRRADDKQPVRKPAKTALKVQPGTDPKRDIVREAFDLVLRMNREQRAEFFDLYLEK